MVSADSALLISCEHGLTVSLIFAIKDVLMDRSTCNFFVLAKGHLAAGRVILMPSHSGHQYSFILMSAEESKLLSESILFRGFRAAHWVIRDSKHGLTTNEVRGTCCFAVLRAWRSGWWCCSV